MNVQFFVVAHIIVSIAAINKEEDIIDFRPILSDKGPMNSVPIAIVPVAIDRDKLLSVAVKENSLENIGKIDCTQYKIEKLEKPPKKRDKII